MQPACDLAPLISASLIRGGDRRALSRAITQAESTRPDHRAAALALLAALPPRPDTLRIGLTGAPGAGKSTFIESFGLMLTARGHRVAVLAVDPSSARSGGSILGDKTRMDRLARDPRAFIRPSPNRTEPGGVARRTADAVALCEAAGFDVILIETVGVGQSETEVSHLCDLFVLLLAPGGGDDLQGVKRGIMELADLLIVTKADGDLEPAARRTAADHAAALHLFRHRPADPPGFPRVVTLSAHDGTGLAPAWDALQDLAAFRRGTGHFAANRAAQTRHRFLAELHHGRLAALATPAARAEIDRLGTLVAQGTLAPETAAADLLARLPL